MKQREILNSNKFANSFANSGKTNRMNLAACSARENNCKEGIFMNFKFSEEQELIRKSMEETVAGAEKKDPNDLLKDLAGMGFIGLFYPEGFGGSEGDFLSFIINLETLAKVSASSALALAIQSTQVAYSLFNWGSSKLRERYLIALNGGGKTGTYAYSEQGIGSDQIAIDTVAKKQDDFYLLNGTKTFVINADKNDFLIAFATVDGRLSVFVVDRVQQGVTISDPYRKMGLDGLSAVTVTFKNVRVPKDNLLGEEGDGESIAQGVNELFSVGIAAIAAGLSETAREKAIAYGKQRIQFGRPVISFDALQEKIGIMSVNIEATRLLTYKAAVNKDEGEPLAQVAKIARYHALTTGINNCREAIQIHGGYGYTRDLGIEALYRDMEGLKVIESQTKPLILNIAAEAIEV
ncbi:acyl-CoA dehydrogenase family protein [Sporolactobacillus sp. CQH2019]|uniref:acyl-CoA dehydrogenase family protein n=1 Tax=Sporolactobacillus sp. CQH2019 TaxID=3023512 RepID=UPI0023680958|nr:acyl-CoA dehydrogenase family protein [Sporolactobacillus sp. CQH2019]